MAPQVSQVTEPVSLGEGPHWDEDTHSLYFVSIFDYTIHRASSVYETAKLDEEPTFIIPIANKPNHFVVGLGRRVVALKWALGATTIVGALPALDDHNPGNRCNDAKCDPRGRLFVGTMGSEIASGQFDLKKGSLYRVDPDGRTHRVATDIDISNGMCWDVKEKAFYFIDSFEYTIRRYDYDIDTGEIVNPRCVFRFSEHVLEGIADGMTVDTDGCLWVANFDGHQVLKIDPRTSSLLEKIPIPASQVTSVAWGGTDLDVLFVTTASMDRGVKQLPPAGAVFAVNGLGVHGLKADKAKMAPQVSQVTEPLWLGEGPHWDADTQTLYFVSIFDYTIHRYHPASGVHEKAKLDEKPTFIIPIANKPNHFLVSVGRRVVALKWAEGATTIVGALPALDDHNPGNRCNDAKCDPRGRLFVGTMGSEIAPGQFDLKKGSLYRVDPDGRTHRVATDIDISNGMCWDVKEKAFYFIDSFEYTIRRYDYDIDTGEIANPRCVFRFSEHGLEGIADGMTVDTDGCLWVANFDGHQVLKIDPRTSSLLEKIPIPASQVTSVAWGGTGLDVLFVTTASMDRGVKQLPPAGAVFAVNGLGVHGLKADSAKVEWIGGDA